jgi:hypothetical protein
MYKVAAAAARPAGKATIRMEFTYDEPGLGKGGTVALLIIGKKVSEGKIDRQAVGQQALIESLGDNTSWMFADPAVTKGWKDDIGEAHQAVAALQQLGQKKATEADLKEQVVRTDKAWDKVMQRYDDAKQYKPALRGFVARLDQGFARLAQLTGIKDRRAALTDGITD